MYPSMLLWLLNFCGVDEKALLDNDSQRSDLRYSGTLVYFLNPFQILRFIPNRTYTKLIFPIRNKGIMMVS